MHICGSITIKGKKKSKFLCVCCKGEVQIFQNKLCKRFSVIFTIFFSCLCIWIAPHLILLTDVQNLPTVTCFTSTTLQPINHRLLEKAVKTLCPADMAENCFHHTTSLKILRKVLALFSLATPFLATDVFADLRTPFQDTQKHKSKVSKRM